MGMIWGLIGNVWVEYQVVTWSMASWLVGKKVTTIWMISSVLVLVSLRVPQTWSVTVLVLPGTLSHPQGIRGAEYGGYGEQIAPRRLWWRARNEFRFLELPSLGLVECLVEGR